MPHPISLEPDQYKRLQEIAQAQGNTFDATLRNVIDRGLESLQAHKQRRLQALQNLVQLRSEIAQTQENFLDNPISEIREERFRQIDPFA